MRRLQVSDWPELERFLRQDVVANLFLIGVMERASDGLSPPAGFLGIERAGELRAVTYVSGGGLAVCYAPDPSDAWELGRSFRYRGRARLYVGPREATDAFFQGAGPRFEPRLRLDHRLYLLRRGELRVPAEADVRLALPRDLDLTAENAAAMQTEELGIDPRLVDAERFRRRIAGLIAESVVYVLPVGAEFGFQASAATRCGDGTQVESVYTPPALRRRGYATTGLAGMCDDLLRRYPIVTLHVNEANLPAVRLYERLGFRRGAPFRMISA